MTTTTADLRSRLANLTTEWPDRLAWASEVTRTCEALREHLERSGDVSGDLIGDLAAHLDQRSFKMLARSTIPQLRGEGLEKIVSTNARAMIGSLAQDATPDLAPEVVEDLALLKEEEERYQQQEVYRMGLILFDSQELSAAQVQQARSLLATDPRFAAGAVTEGPKRSEHGKDGKAVGE